MEFELTCISYLDKMDICSSYAKGQVDWLELDAMAVGGGVSDSDLNHIFWCEESLRNCFLEIIINILFFCPCLNASLISADNFKLDHCVLFDLLCILQL